MTSYYVITEHPEISGGVKPSVPFLYQPLASVIIVQQVDGGSMAEK